MRPRVKQGTLVASTNPYTRILSCRLIIKVRYTFKRGIINQRVIDVRETLLQ